MNLQRITLNLFSVTAMAALLFGTSARVIAADKGGKKLLVYILAGQSNMQGHAEASTLAYLPKSAYVPTPEEWALMTGGLERSIRLKSEASISEQLLKDPANAKLPKKEFGELVKKSSICSPSKPRKALLKQRTNGKTSWISRSASTPTSRLMAASIGAQNPASPPAR
jgi:hypothetical protein